MVTKRFQCFTTKVHEKLTKRISKLPPHKEKKTFTPMRKIEKI